MPTKFGVSGCRGVGVSGCRGVGVSFFHANTIGNPRAPHAEAFANEARKALIHANHFQIIFL